MEGASKESEVKAAANKATNSVSSAGTSSADTTTYTAASAFKGASNSNISVVGVAFFSLSPVTVPR